MNKKNPPITLVKSRYLSKISAYLPRQVKTFFFKFSSSRNTNKLAVALKLYSPSYKTLDEFLMSPRPTFDKVYVLYFIIFFSKFSNKTHSRYTVTAVISLLLLREQNKITNQFNNVKKKKDLCTCNHYIKSTM